MTWLTDLEERLSAAGFDLTRRFRVSWYNREVPPEHQLPTLGRGGAELGLLIGNTRELWPHFETAIRARPDRIEASDPFDDWVTERVGALLEGVPVDWRVRFAHDQAPRLVSMTRLAVVSGLAWLAPVHLCIHERYGPWFSLRAVAVFDNPGPDGDRAHLPPPCDACEQTCEPAMRAIRVAGSSWRDWLAVRDACPIGRAHRFSERQLRYHYTKDRRLLRDLVDH